MATQTQIVREAPEIEALKLGLMESAKKLADKKITIPDYEVEGLTDIQKNILAQVRGDEPGFYDPMADVKAARKALATHAQD